MEMLGSISRCQFHFTQLVQLGKLDVPPVDLPAEGGAIRGMSGFGNIRRSKLWWVDCLLLKLALGKWKRHKGFL